jgi:hypothetical protein
VRGRSHNAIMCASLNMSRTESQGVSLKAPSGILRHTVRLSNHVRHGVCAKKNQNNVPRHNEKDTHSANAARAGIRIGLVTS